MSKFYTQEQKEWIKENAPFSTLKQLTLLFNETFNENKTRTSINKICLWYGIKSLSSNYSLKELKEQNMWLFENADKFDVKELTEKFNKTFNHELSVESLRSRLYNNNITYKKIFEETYEEINWLKENSQKYHIFALTREFNKKFNKNLTHVAISERCKKNNLNYIRKDLHRYTKEEKQWISNNYKNYMKDDVMDWVKMTNDFNVLFNCNVNSVNYAFYYCQDKRLENQSKNHFTSENANQELNRKKIGDKRRKKNFIFVKINDVNYGSDYHADFINNYRRETNIYYEKYHNVKVNDEEEIVIPLDDNYENYEKDNLYLTTKKAYRIYITTKYKNEDKQTKLNALKVSEILALTKE